MKTMICVGMMMVAWMASARLGETQLELVARYGKVVQTNAHPDRLVLYWDFKGREVCVILRDGKSVSEVVTAASTRDEISLDQAKAIATNISGVTNWAKAETDRMFAEAYMDPKGQDVGFVLEHAPLKRSTVIVTTKKELERRAQDRKKSDKSAADGF